MPYVLRAAAQYICVTIFSTGGKFRTVLNFTKLHVLTPDAHSYAFLYLEIALTHNVSHLSSSNMILPSLPILSCGTILPSSSSSSSSPSPSSLSSTLFSCWREREFGVCVDILQENKFQSPCSTEMIIVDVLGETGLVCLASFPGLLWPQLLITCSVQNTASDQKLEPEQAWERG